MINWASRKYRFEHWFFQWVQDSDGCVGLKIAGVITFFKYKKHTIIRVGRRQRDKLAPKHLVKT